MSVLELKLYTSVGGRSSVNNCTNSFVVQSELALTDVGFPAAVKTYMAHLTPVFLQNTYFMRVVASTLPHEGRKGHPEAFRSVELNNIGEAPIAPPYSGALPLDIALGCKLGGVSGRSGLYLFRNALTESDVEGSGRNGFIITATMAAQQAALAAMLADNASFQLGIANRKTGDVASFRAASSFQVSNVVIKHHDIRGKKRTTATTPEGGSGLLAEALPLVAGAVAFFLTKKPGAFTAAQKLTAVTSATSVGELASQLIKHLTDPVVP